VRIHAVDVDGTVHAADERRPRETLCGREHDVELIAAGLREPQDEDLDRASSPRTPA
jgi:hypothetical protein